MKKMASLFLTALLLLSSAMVVTNAQNEIRVVLNGKAVEFEQPPMIISDRTMVPVRAIYEALGAEVEWDAQTRTASGTKDGITVSFVIDEAFVTVNGSKKEIDAPACIVNDRTLVPVRALAEGFDTKVEWDGINRIVFIYDDNYAKKEKNVKAGKSLIMINDMSNALQPIGITLSGNGFEDFSDVKVTKTGKNLLDISKVVTGTNAEDLVIDKENGKVEFRKTTPAASSSYVYVDIYLPVGDYTLSGKSTRPEDMDPSIQVYDVENKKYVNKNPGGFKYNDGAFEIIESKVYQIRFYAQWSHKAETVVSFSNMQIECGFVASDYEAYNGQTVAATKDGKVLGLTSVGKSAVIIADNPNVDIKCEYLSNKLTMPAVVKAEKLAHGDKIEVLENCLKKNKTLELAADIDSFESLIIRHGGPSVYSSSYIEINSTEIKAYNCHGGESLTRAEKHSLSFEEKISVLMEVSTFSQLSITLSDGQNTFSMNDILWAGSHGMVEAESINSELHNVVLTWNCIDYEKDIWVFGDSWVQLQNNGWPMYLLSENDSFLLSGFGGSKASDMYGDWICALDFGKPKFAVWAVGMNNPDATSEINTSWERCTDLFIEDCNERGITPILVTIPNTPTRTHIYKNEYIRNSGCRYIDFATAMGGNEAGSTWHAGYAMPDGNHATVEGAKVLAQQILKDLPEIK